MSDQFEMFTADGKPRKRQPGRPRKPVVAQAPKPPKPAKLVTVQLQLRHTVNGKNYGPGMVTVSESLARMFQNTEANVADKELSLVQQRAYIITFGPRGPQKRQVPWEKFNQILNGQSGTPLESMTGDR